MIEFVPIAIRTLMLADQALSNALGDGDEMRVYPVEAPDGAELPYVVYHQMEEQVISSKDGDIPNGWSLMLEVVAQDPGAYMTASRICRLTKNAINRQVSAVLDDAGETFNVRFKGGGQENITPEESKDLIIIALAFRAVKIS